MIIYLKVKKIKLNNNNKKIKKIYTKVTEFHSLSVMMNIEKIFKIAQKKSKLKIIINLMINKLNRIK